MKRSGDDIRSLVGLLDADLAHLDTLVLANAHAEERIIGGADDPLDYAALGYPSAHARFRGALPALAEELD